MTPREIHAYAAGYRSALRKARRELAEMVGRWDDEIAELDDRMRLEHEQTIKDIGDKLVELIVEMQGMRNEFYRLKAVEAAIDVERGPNTLLN